MCVSTGADLDGLKAEDKFCAYACMHDNKSDLKLNLNPGSVLGAWWLWHMNAI